MSTPTQPAKIKLPVSAIVAIVIIDAIIVAAILWYVLGRKSPTQGAQPQPAIVSMGKMDVITPSTPAEQVINVRGRIIALPGPTNAFFQMHHEVLPEFVHPDGSLGMKEMIMDFPSVKAGTNFEGLRAGDAVEVTWEIRYKSEPRSLITGITKLDPTTTLNLSPILNP